MLYDMRIAKTQQLLEASGRSLRLLQRSLQRLYELKFVDRFFPQVQQGSSQGIYYLDQLGAHYLSAVNDLPKKLIWDPRDNLVKEDKIVHTLHITDMRAALEANIRLLNMQDGQRITMDRFWGEKRVGRREYTHHGMVYEINPDSELFIVQETGSGDLYKRFMSTYLLEYDRGTEQLNQVAEKIDKYKAYYGSSEFTKYYKGQGYPEPDLVIITNGDLSERRFKKAIEDNTEISQQIRVKMITFESFLADSYRLLKAK